MSKKKAREHKFSIYTSGRGMMKADVCIGLVTVKSKTSDIDTLREKARDQISGMVTDPHLFNFRYMGIDGEN